MKRLIYKLNNESNYEELTCGYSSLNDSLRIISVVIPFGIKNNPIGNISLENETYFRIDKTYFICDETDCLRISLISKTNLDDSVYSVTLTLNNFLNLQRLCNQNNQKKAPFLIISREDTDIVTILFQDKLSDTDLIFIQQTQRMQSLTFILGCIFWIFFVLVLIISHCTTQATTASLKTPNHFHS